MATVFFQQPEGLITSIKKGTLSYCRKLTEKTVAIVVSQHESVSAVIVEKTDKTEIWNDRFYLRDRIITTA
ncbi:hypothetical protein ACFSKU_21400 [Pontibacter silvestris]|uniref:Uncharacterized protein n=1 Tax=Pontibacter silvestris TaxID=2305183 RepID=A0ABW4X3A7_9BACT|nr:hypothetical protein [Pontibacter silvestris]MCC9137889.1 hypothetical protein [Pontibacter silvestris]